MTHEPEANSLAPESLVQEGTAAPPSWEGSLPIPSDPVICGVNVSRIVRIGFQRAERKSAEAASEFGANI